MPIDLTKYPEDWKRISLAIRNRAGWQCECSGECGLHSGRRCMEIDSNPAVWAKGKVVLTVAHLNHEPSDCGSENLKAMCQRCHLRYDNDLHVKNRKANRRRKVEQIQDKLPF